MQDHAIILPDTDGAILSRNIGGHLVFSGCGYKFIYCIINGCNSF